MNQPSAASAAQLGHAARTVGRVVGRVQAVQAFPVKSLQAVPALSVRPEGAGIAGDRRYAVVADEGTDEGTGGGVVSAEDAPRLREVVAGLGPDGVPLLTLPGGAAGLPDRGADQALTALLGRPVRVAEVRPGSALEAPVHLISRQALE